MGSGNPAPPAPRGSAPPCGGVPRLPPGPRAGRRGVDGGPLPRAVPRAGEGPLRPAGGGRRRGGGLRRVAVLAGGHGGPPAPRAAGWGTAGWFSRLCKCDAYGVEWHPSPLVLTVGLACWIGVARRQGSGVTMAFVTLFLLSLIYKVALWVPQLFFLF